MPPDLPTPLEDQILAAFKRALAEGRLDVAEHLLQALEALQPDPVPGSATAGVYSSIGRKAGFRAPAESLRCTSAARSVRTIIRSLTRALFRPVLPPST